MTAAKKTKTAAKNNNDSSNYQSNGGNIGAICTWAVTPSSPRRAERTWSNRAPFERSCGRPPASSNEPASRTEREDSGGVRRRQRPSGGHGGQHFLDVLCQGHPLQHSLCAGVGLRRGRQPQGGGLQARSAARVASNVARSHPPRGRTRTQRTAGQQGMAAVPGFQQALNDQRATVLQFAQLWPTEIRIEKRGTQNILYPVLLPAAAAAAPRRKSQTQQQQQQRLARRALLGPPELSWASLGLLWGSLCPPLASLGPALGPWALVPWAPGPGPRGRKNQ